MYLEELFMYWHKNGSIRQKRFPVDQELQFTTQKRICSSWTVLFSQNAMKSICDASFPQLIPRRHFFLLFSTKIWMNLCFYVTTLRTGKPSSSNRAFFLSISFSPSLSLTYLLFSLSTYSSSYITAPSSSKVALEGMWYKGRDVVCAWVCVCVLAAVAFDHSVGTAYQKERYRSKHTCDEAHFQNV